MTLITNPGLTNPGQPAHLHLSPLITSTKCTTQVTSPAASRAASSSTHATSLKSPTHPSLGARGGKDEVVSGDVWHWTHEHRTHEHWTHGKDEVVSGDVCQGRASGVVGKGVEGGSLESWRQGSTDGGGGGGGGGGGEGVLRLDTRLPSPTVCLVSSAPMSPVRGWGGGYLGVRFRG
jgi:hypothetical protein